MNLQAKRSAHLPKRLIFGYLTLIFIIASSCNQEGYEIQLNDLPFKEIVNDYGVPKRNQSFALTPLNIAGERFVNGLGLHAPAKIHIDLNGKGILFKAQVGIDSAKHYYDSEAGWDALNRKRKPVFPADHVYDNRIQHDDVTLGGTAILKIFLDGKEVYNSGLMTSTDPAKFVQLDLQGTKILTILAEPTDDGAYIDYVDLAEASIVVKKSVKPAIYCHPENILVNHVGFHPKAPKKCYLHGAQDADFELIDTYSDQSVFSGKMLYKPGNIGEYLVGDFSGFQKPGEYYLACGDKTSVTFRIDDKVLDDCLKQHLFFVSQKRSGHPTKGWRPGFHFDDGVRDDNGKHQDVVGGWDDACDQNKSTYSNSSVLEALAKLGNHPSFDIGKDELTEEIKWGCNYLHKMQEPEGYLMTTVRLAQWTDNIVGTEDDRVITTAPARRDRQLIFVRTQLDLYEYFKDSEPAYARQCIDNGIRCLEWIMEEPGIIVEPSSVAEAAMVFCQLYQYKKIEPYKTAASTWIKKLLKAKYTDTENMIVLYARISNGDFNNFSLNRIINGLNCYANVFPDDELTIECIQTIRELSDQFFKPFCSQNAFGIVPWRVSTDSIPTGKKVAKYYYSNGIHVGMNSNLAMKGNELAEAFRVTNDQELLELAQPQLDWIYGANPFNASTVYGLGYNQPVLFKAHIPYFYPPRTPEIPGGGVVGFCSDEFDNLAMYPGWWYSTEYWGPFNGALIRLENSLNNIYNN